jgi:translation initiation factor 1
MRDRDAHTLVYGSERGPAAGRHATASSQGRNAAGAGEAGARGTERRDGAPADGVVRIWLERQGRNGKPVSIVRGLRLDTTALTALAARLKRTCGTGGTAKDGEILLQGDHRERIAAALGKDGLRVKLAGG